jgi:SAM-dependent methyltransferase
VSNVKRLPEDAYRDDLAYIHDVGFGSFATHAAPFVLELLKATSFRRGQVVELGCGSGIVAAALSEAGYDVLGFDISRAMVELARKRAPAADIRQGSFVNAPLPPCVLVLAIGEIFNYLFDKHNTKARLSKVFRTVHKALVPGGQFVFDVALVGRVPKGRRRGYTLGNDWACLYEAEENTDSMTLTRRITSFRKQGDAYHRDDEVHYLRLYERSWLVEELRSAGFRVRTVKAYGELTFPPGYLGFVARKD